MSSSNPPRHPSSIDVEKGVFANGIHVGGDLVMGDKSAPRARPTDNLVPAGVRMNQAFVGRADDLRRLHDALTHDNVALTHALTGEGGIGKTQLAARYVLSDVSAKHWEGRWWLDASEAAVETSLAGLARLLLDRDVDPKTPFAELVAEVCAALSRGRNLLVLDNVETRERVEQFNLHAPARLLITTRRTDLPSSVAANFPVDRLPMDDAVQLLARDRRDLRDSQHRPGLEAVCEHLARHTFALAMAAAYLKRHPSVGPAELLQRLKKADVGDKKHLFEGLKPGELGTQYRLSVAETLALHLPDFAKTPAMRLLNAAAFCHPDAIPVELLSAAAGLDAEATEEWLRKLADVSILTFDGTVHVHRLMQSVLRGRMKKGERRKALAGLCSVLKDWFGHSDDVPSWPALDRLATHGVSIVQHASVVGDVAAAGFVANDVGMFAQHMGRFAAARRALELAIHIGTAELGRDHPNVATAISSLATVLCRLGNLEAARSHLERAMQINRKHFPADHPTLARDYSNLAFVLQEIGEFVGAKALMERAIAIDEKSLAADHPTLAMQYSNLAMILKDSGDLSGALAYIARAIAIDRRHFDESHPTLAMRYHNFALVLFHMGDLKVARETIEVAITIQEQHFGPDHPDLATSRHNLAGILAAGDDFQGAIREEELALGILLKHFDETHSRVKISRECLAEYLARAGRTAQ